jgi:hypothetical protein
MRWQNQSAPHRRVLAGSIGQVKLALRLLRLGQRLKTFQAVMKAFW